MVDTTPCGTNLVGFRRFDEKGAVLGVLLRQAVVEAIEAGTMRRADPDLMSLFLWSTVHGLVTLVLACRLKPVDECGEAPTPQGLFECFAPFVRAGIQAAGAESR